MNSPRDMPDPWAVVVPERWPEAPAAMTVTTYAEIDECPRRWALGAADYGNLWRGRGYPPKPQVAALAGSVVHCALEVITKRLARAGASSEDQALVTSVLKDLGGYSNVVMESIEQVLRRFALNPRAAKLLEHARTTLRGRVPALRTRVQSLLSRLRLPGASSPEASVNASGGRRTPLAPGAHSEAELRAPSIGWKGKADLIVVNNLGCEITDFKTGASSESHSFQLKVYAVLWLLDAELNPSALTVERLVLAYDGADVDVQPPRKDEVDQLVQDLVARREAAEKALTLRPPVARPSADACRYCGVRQLCDEYWERPTNGGTADAPFGDVEIAIAQRHGPKSWDAIVLRSNQVPATTPALLRLEEPIEFIPGTRVRILDGAFSLDAEDPTAPLIVTLCSFSETYRVGVSR